MTYKLKVQNISSGDIIYGESSSLIKYNYSKTMNWETTPVVGRMDPIYNFRNTEAKIEIAIEASDFYYCKLNDTPTQDKLNEFNKKISSKKEAIDFRGSKKSEAIPFSYYNTGDGFQGFFYPSYQQNGSTFQVKTAPVFRVKLFNQDREYVSVYCTIPSFAYSKDKYTDATGKSYIIALDLVLNVIHTKPELVGSKFFNTGGTITSGSILGQ